MATLIKGLLSFNLDWQFVLVGVILAITVELCGVKSLSFAVGAYLPLSTTLPIFGGGMLKALVDWRTVKKQQPGDEELSKGNLFATGLVAGGALAGVVVALLSVNENVFNSLERINAEHGLSAALGSGGYQLFGVAFFVLMAVTLYRIALRKSK
jgi:uncharacterized oligopeptide transporter (OPT) family protein